MSNNEKPTLEEVLTWFHEENNWGRWGPDDELGALNLVDEAKRVRAAGLVSTGQTVSMSRPLSTEPGVGNARPVSHFMKIDQVAEHAGSAIDYYGAMHHGVAVTHLDALCHMWDEQGMYNGRQPEDVLTFDGTKFGGVQVMSAGIVTRGVLLDVPRFRGGACVEQDTPVHGSELQMIAESQGVEIEPGDAIAVYCGRELWDERHGRPWGSTPAERAGLHISCVDFLRKHDAAVLAWDMMDLRPSGYDVPWAVHGVIHSLGMAVVDNCDFSRVARACAELGRYEFMFVIAPLVLPGGTGCPANPLAVF